MQRSNYSIIFVVYLLLSVVGLVMLTSIAPDKFWQQALLVVLGALIMLYLARQDAVIFQNFALVIYLATVVMLLSTFVFGSVVRGSVRWIDIAGFRFQPSELAKPLLIVAFAGLMTRYPPRNIKNILLQLGLYLLPTLLIFRQPDLGTALVISFIWAVMIFLANIPLPVVGVGVLTLILGGYFSPHFLKDYQLNRLRTFLDPYHDPLGSGYNVIQAIIAVGSGQLIGKGLGHGTQSHFRFLPERHTDFMFASLAEELGLVGALSVVILYFLLIKTITSFMLEINNSYLRLLCGGVFAYFVFQLGINIGMNLGVAPVTGITLPLISYGGSSVLATAIILGILLSAAKHLKPSSVIEIR